MRRICLLSISLFHTFYRFEENICRSVKLKPYANRKMAYSSLDPPEHVRGMTVLNKLKFNKAINVPMVKIKDIKVSDVLPFLKSYLLKVENLKPVTSSTSEVHILLNPDVIKDWSDINVKDRDSLAKHNITKENLHFHVYTLTYENYSANAILKAVLPPDKEGLTSFSKIGHIIHINLREHLLPYKALIGQVLYDKIPGVRTVVNKVDMIDNTYRNFKMEVLCGYNEMMVKVKENKCNFEFDFSFVYWNPRLSTEHERIINLLNPGDILFDVFAGVGPFAIPAAKKRCYVFANDLNPESYKWLNHNATLNKFRKEYLHTFNKDGRDFILTDLKYYLKQHIISDTPQKNTKSVHITMNLPALAIQFASNFFGLYSSEELPEINIKPLVHVYCFTKGENPVEIAKSSLQKSMNCDLSDSIVDIFKVRTVSSLKEMMRISFLLHRDVLIGSRPKLNKRKINESGDESESTMGKDQRKKKNIFIVPNNKNMKVKNAQKSKKQLKKAIQNNEKIREMDSKLVNIEDKLRHSVGKEELKRFTDQSLNFKGSISFHTEEKQENSKEILNGVNKMEL